MIKCLNHVSSDTSVHTYKHCGNFSGCRIAVASSFTGVLSDQPRFGDTEMIVQVSGS